MKSIGDQVITTSHQRMHVTVTGVNNVGDVFVPVAADTLCTSRGSPHSHARKSFHASDTGGHLQSCHSSMKLAHHGADS